MPDIMQQVPTNVPFVRPIHIRNLIISVIILPHQNSILVPRVPRGPARLVIRRPITTVLMIVFRWKQKKYLVIRDIIYPQTVNLAHNVRKIHIALGGRLQNHPQILG